MRSVHSVNFTPIFNIRFMRKRNLKPINWANTPEMDTVELLLPLSPQPPPQQQQQQQQLNKIFTERSKIRITMSPGSLYAPKFELKTKSKRMLVITMQAKRQGKKTRIQFIIMILLTIRTNVWTKSLIRAIIVCLFTYLHRIIYRELWQYHGWPMWMIKLVCKINLKSHNPHTYTEQKNWLALCTDNNKKNLRRRKICLIVSCARCFIPFIRISARVLDAKCHTGEKLDLNKDVNWNLYCSSLSTATFLVYSLYAREIEDSSMLAMSYRIQWFYVCVFFFSLFNTVKWYCQFKNAIVDMDRLFFSVCVCVCREWAD